MIGTLSKDYPITFQLLLKTTDPFDVLWNDWNFLAFFINSGIEVTITKTSFSLSHENIVYLGQVTKDPLANLIKAGFNLLETYFVKKLNEKYDSIK